jgi:elongator complex protein 1
LSNSGTLCCILSGGDIVLVKVETEIHEDRLEIIGNVEGGILAALWTVDEEVLAIASGLPPFLVVVPDSIRSVKTSFHDTEFRDYF